MSVLHDGGHQMYFLGIHEIAQIVPANNSKYNETTTRSMEERMIEQVECAQLSGSLAKNSTNAVLVSLRISKTGIKITNVKDQKVVDRIALHKTIQVTSYEDGYGNCNVVLLVQPNRNIQNCYLFQSKTVDSADSLCRDVKKSFSSIAELAKTQ